MRSGTTVRALLLGILAACAPQAGPTHDPAADRAAIDSLRTAYQEGMKANDAAKVAGYIASDGHDMENGMATMVGPQAVEGGLKGMFDQFTVQDMVISSEKTEVAGDFAYDRGTFRTTMMPKAGGAAVVDSGRYLVVLKRQSDSTWKLVELMGNSTTAPAAPAGK